jgi:hypothetical protein
MSRQWQCTLGDAAFSFYGGYPIETLPVSWIVAECPLCGDFNAPEDLKVRGNCRGGPKFDMEKQPECAGRLAEFSGAIDCRAIREQSYGCLARKVSGPIHLASIVGSVNRIREGAQTR